MAGNIKGITIELNGDTTQLDKAIQGVNKTASQLTKEIKAINTSMKFNPEAFDLLEQKSRASEEAIGNLRDKLEILKEAQVQAAEALEKGELGQDKYDALTREIMKTENQIKSYEGELKKLTKEEFENAKASKERQSELSKLGKENDALTEKSNKLTKEYELQVASLGNNAKESDKLALAQQNLSKQIDNSTQIVQNLEKQLELAKVEYGENSSEVANLEIVLLDAKKTVADFANEYAAMGGTLSEATQKILSAGESLESFGKDMSMKLTAPLTAVGALSFTMAADVEDALGATDQIFKDNADTIKDWADSLEPHYGIAKKQALEYANTMGAMLKNIGGLTEEAAAKQTQILTELAGDLSAMFGGTTESAVQALTGALKGNYAMLDNYGMGVNAATVKMKALEMGLGDGTKELTLQEKQAAALALIMEQTADAQGQAAREADGASGSMKAFTTEIQNLRTEIGEELLPIFTPLIAGLADFVGGFKELNDPTKKAIVVIGLFLAALGPILLILGKLLTAFGTVTGAIEVLTKGATATTPAMAALSKIFGGLVEAGGAVKGAFVAIAAALGIGPGALLAIIVAVIAAIVLLVKNFDSIKEFAGEAKDVIGEFFDSVNEKSKDFFGPITDVLKEKFESIKEGVTNFKTAIEEGLDALDEKALEWVDSFAEFFTTLWENIKVGAGEAWEGIQAFFAEVFTNITTSITELFEGMKEYLLTVWEGLKEDVITTWGSITESLTEVFSTLTEFLVTTFDSLKENLVQKWSEIKENVMPKVEEIREGIQTAWENINKFTDENFKEISKKIIDSFGKILESTKKNWEDIKKVVADNVKKITDQVPILKDFGDLISRTWKDIEDGTKRSWEKNKEAIGKPIKDALDGLKDFMQKVRDLFSKEISFPKIKLPKFKLEGSFSLNPPSVPTLDVSWHKKGAIFTRPTIFNTPGGLHGVGEAGAEAVLPIEKLSGIIADAMRKVGGTGSQYIFNVSFDEISELQDFVNMAKRAERMKRMGWKDE